MRYLSALIAALVLVLSVSCGSQSERLTDTIWASEAHFTKLYITDNTSLYADNGSQIQLSGIKGDTGATGATGATGPAGAVGPAGIGVTYLFPGTMQQGNFEQSANGWTSPGTWSYSSSSPKLGSYAGKYTASGAWNDVYNTNWVLTGSHWAGANITVSMWVKTDAANTGLYYVGFYDASDGWHYNASLNNTKTTWQKETLSYVVPATSTTYQVAAFTNGTSGDILYIDDVRIVINLPVQ